jgi:hypothetical protein
LELTHDELLAKIDSLSCCSGVHELALKSVVELHKPDYEQWSDGSGCLCNNRYPCPTIEAIEKEIG